MSAPATPGVGVLRALVARATLAPSLRNAQPWRWTVHPDHVELELDAGVAERLHANDPRGRELIMSCGAALLTLRVAAAEAVLDARVDMEPDPHRPTLLATVTMETGVVDATFADLDAVVPLRHTSWTAFDGAPVPAALVRRLAAEAKVEGVQLAEVPPDQRDPLAELLRHADQARYDDPERRAEMAEWISSRWSDDGKVVPAVAVVPTRTAVRHLDLGDRIAAHDAGLLAQAPLVGVLATDGDTTADWLAAGQALQRVLLVAAAEGFLAGFLNAPCQVEEDRERLRDLLPGRPFPQLVLRLGHPRSRPLGTPRRSVDDVVLVQVGPHEGAAEVPLGRVREAAADYTEDTLG